MSLKELELGLRCTTRMIGKIIGVNRASIIGFAHACMKRALSKGEPLYLSSKYASNINFSEKHNSKEIRWPIQGYIPRDIRARVRG
jgi:hypothetical protein